MPSAITALWRLLTAPVVSAYRWLENFVRPTEPSVRFLRNNGVPLETLSDDIKLDVLYWLDRAALEGLQMHSRHLRNLVDRHAGSLPRRYFHEVEVCASAVHCEFKRLLPLVTHITLL